MKTASLELSKELYELSGWEDTVWDWSTANGKLMYRTGSSMFHRDDYPAYDLGYLLRKLENIEETIILRYNNPARMGAVALPQWNGQYTVATARMQQRDYPIAATPEDAVASLCVALFKQGILTKEKPDEQ